MWLTRDEADIEKAYKTLDPEEGDSLKRTSSLKESEGRPLTRDSDSDSSIHESKEERMLQKSAISLNLKIKNLGEEFKHKRILDRLKMLKINRDNEVHFTESQEDEDEDENEENIVVRECSTCKNSIDFLGCSKEENKRKSFARWQSRPSPDINTAIQELENIEDSKTTVDSSHDVGNELHKSTMSLNLKVKNLGKEFKQERILERLKLLKIDRGNKIHYTESQEADIGNEENEVVRECSTCKNSIDFLECSKEENKRKSIARWISRPSPDIETAIEKMEGTEDSNTSIDSSQNEANELHQSTTSLNLK